MNIHSIRKIGSRSKDARRTASGRYATCLALTICVAFTTETLAQGVSASLGSTANASGKIGSVFRHGEQSYRVVSPAAYAADSNVGRAPAGTIAQTGFFLKGGRCDSDCDAACVDCGGFGGTDYGSVDYGSMGCGGACGGACGSCGGYGSMGGNGSMDGYGAMSCPTCDPYFYGTLELLFMQRTGSRNISVSEDFFLNDFNYELAPRLVVGYVPDCVQGYEFSYTGRFSFDRGGFQSDPAGGIQTLLRAVAPLQQSDLSAFSNATTKAQRYNGEYWSFDANRAMVGWDIAKLLVGVRYIDYDENFTAISQNLSNEIGLLRSDIDNRMLGVQVGMDLLYPICRNVYTDFRGRAGLYANFVDLDFAVFNADQLKALLLDDTTKIAANVEIGSGVRYQFTERFSIRTGIELWYIDGVASARDQFSDGIVARRTVRASDDITIVGFNVGADLRY
jgi:hypothetical protein